MYSLRNGVLMAFYAILIISKVKMHLTNLKISVIHFKKYLVLQGHSQFSAKKIQSSEDYETGRGV